MRRWTLLLWLDNSVMRSDIDPNAIISEVFQLRDKLSDLGEVFSDERLTSIIIDALSEEMYSTVKVQLIRDPDLGLEEIISMMETIFINHSERSSVPKMSQELCRKVGNSDRESTMLDNVRESGMTVTCPNCKKSGHKMKHCKQVMKKSDKSSNVENGTRKWCSYYHSNGHSNKYCYQQRSESANNDNKEIWCSYHKSRKPL